MASCDAQRMNSRHPGRTTGPIPNASRSNPFAPERRAAHHGWGSPCVSRRRMTALGSKPFASGIGTLGKRFLRRQPRSRLTPIRARRRCRIERSDRMAAGHRRVRQSRRCFCQARSSFGEKTSILRGSRDFGERERNDAGRFARGLGTVIDRRRHNRAGVQCCCALPLDRRRRELAD